MNTTPKTDHPVRLAVLVGSTRPSRRGPQAAEWVLEQAAAHLGDRADVEMLDLARFDLPLLDEPMPAAIGDYRHAHTRRWAAAVDGFDGFIIVAPEYNHSMPAALKNAIDYLYAEWNNKAAGFVSYGLNGGTRAVEHLRLALAEVQVATVRSQVSLGLFTDFDIPDMTEPGTFAPAGYHDQVLRRMLDELADWASALRPLRERTDR